jgi:uncharacterized protein (TIGR02271 family)
VPTTEEATRWRGQDLVDSAGDKIGQISDVYLDTETDRPEWLAVTTGLFGSKVSFVPTAEAEEHDGHLHVPYSKDQVKDAPNADADGQLSQQEESRLYAHYGLDYGESRSDSGLPEGTNGGERNVELTGDAAGGAGDTGDTSGPNTDQAMTRSEEELAVGTTRRETGRARLRKHVVTEQVQTTVPVQREEVRIEREPITDANVGDALDGPEISEEEHEVTLHAEEPVVEKRVVPQERVRLQKDTHTEEAQVSDEVRKERIETHGDADVR